MAEAKKTAKKEEKKVEKKTDFQVWFEKNAEKVKAFKNPAEKYEFIFKAGILKGKSLQKKAMAAKAQD